MNENELQELLRRRPALKVAGTSTVTAPVKENAVKGISERLKQTKCEMEYGRLLALEFPGVPIIPWGLTLRMQNSHKYTPDLVVLSPDGYLIVEVKQRGKSGFRQNSYQRAKVVFDQCRVEFSLFRYRFAEKQNGIWDVKNYPCNLDRTEVQQAKLHI